MNSQLLTARDTGLDRLARRTGLALVRWSSRRAEPSRLSSEKVAALRASRQLRHDSTSGSYLLVALSRSTL
jgi:hypothetical protein